MFTIKNINFYSFQGYSDKPYVKDCLHKLDEIKNDINNSFTFGKVLLKSDNQYPNKLYYWELPNKEYNKSKKCFESNIPNNILDLFKSDLQNTCILDLINYFENKNFKVSFTPGTDIDGFLINSNLIHLENKKSDIAVIDLTENKLLNCFCLKYPDSFMKWEKFIERHNK